LSSADWKNRAQKIQLFLLDVDGVLTDGRIAYDEDGREIKFFDVRDGQGIKFLQAGGIEVGFLSSRKSRAVGKRAEELGIHLVREKVQDKLEELATIQGERKVTADQVAYMGDDWVDLPLFYRVGLAVAVPESISELKEKAHYITASPGGRGAVREICEAILKAQGKWGRITKRFFPA
jgi:3-deoxy-D-manno-octulosonate 8-phosphate phosphatase (KDO 8-P phosphatase)